MQADDVTPTDERLQSFTLSGVNVAIKDSYYTPWVYDSENNRVISGNKGVYDSESTIKLTFSAEQAFCLSFEYGASGQLDLLTGRYGKAYFYIDGFLYKVICNPTPIPHTFSYVFEDGNEHVIEVKYKKGSSGGEAEEGEGCAYLKNIVAKTDITDAVNTTTLYATSSGDDVVLKYAPIQLPCSDLDNTFEVPDDYYKKDVRIEESAKDYAPTSFYRFFMMLNPTSITGLSNLNTSQATNMSKMFYRCSVEELDISSFNTEKVTDMSYMFALAKSNSINLGQINTKNVIDMSKMFMSCSNIETLDLSSLNTENVKKMYEMFYNCTSLKSLDLSSFNTGKVTNMDHMFYYCKELANLNLSNLNVENVTNMNHMFYACFKLKSLDLSTLKTEKVTDMSYMFSFCQGLESLKLPQINTGSEANMSYMFEQCKGLETLDLSPLNTGKVTNMNHMFYACRGLETLDLSPLNTENVTNMSYMFEHCEGLKTLDLSPLNTENVTNMSYMFSYCNGLETLDLSPLNTENVKNMYEMLGHCTSLKTIVLPLNTGNVQSMTGMFKACNSLQTLDLSSLNTENVTTMSDMFSFCTGLQTLNLSSLSTGKLKYMERMFKGCTALETLDLSTFNTENVISMTQMFLDCTSLKTLDLSGFNTRSVTNMYQMFYNCSSLTTIYVNDNFALSAIENNNTVGMFYLCSNLVGAIPFDSSKNPSEVANYKTGYFKTYYQVGDIKHELFGEELKVDNLELKDGEDFKAIVPFTATNVTYNREVKSATNGRLRGTTSRWGSICLPYAITAPANCQLYTLSGVQMDNTTNEGTIIMKEVDQLEAGTPAFYCVKDASVTSVNFNASDAAIVNTLVDNSENAVDGVYLKGTYTTQAIDEGYVLMNNSMWNAATIKAQNSGKTVNSKGLRAYLALAPNASAAAQKLNFDAKPATGIESVINAMNDADAEIYDASGRRQGSLQRGLNIIRQANGKSVKVMVK